MKNNIMRHDNKRTQRMPETRKIVCEMKEVKREHQKK